MLEQMNKGSVKMNDIREKVKSILISEFDVKNDRIKDSEDISFFLANIAFNPKSFIYFVLYIEKAFGIRFSENDFDNENFYNLSGFCDILSDYCKIKENAC